MAAPPTRPWMDASPDRFAYRCLPMLIANQSGWLILNDISFEAKWNGESADDGVEIRFLDDGLDLEPETQASLEACVVSHFGAASSRGLYPTCSKRRPDGAYWLAARPTGRSTASRRWKVSSKPIKLPVRLR